MSPQVAGPQIPLRLLAGSSGSAMFAGRLGPIAGSPCAAVQNLLFQRVLFEDLHYVGVPSSHSAGPSSALPTPKSKDSRCTPSSSPAAGRGWGDPALPSPGLLGTE